MPERVHTRFEDEDLKSSVVPKRVTVPAESQPSKKRKREHLRTPSDSAVLADASAESHATKPQSQRVKSPDNVRTPKVKLNGKVPPHQIKQQQQSPKPDHGALSARKQALLRTRQTLPIWSHQQEIRSALRAKDVLVLSGETGSGKSTQVPQFLQYEQWCSGRVAVTQPRRVAAISLARRVAEEVGTLLGSASPASKVGYSVRFDNSTSPSTKIKFLTEGMLLQEMLRDANLKDYSLIIVDEVHERSVNVDLILGFLRKLVTSRKGTGKPLKVVVMSATAEVEKLSRFFDEGYETTTGNSSSLVNGQAEAGSDSESESSWSGFSSETSNTKQPRRDASKLKTSQPNGTRRSIANSVQPSTATHSTRSGTYKPIHTSISTIEGRQHPVETMYLTDATTDLLDACLKSILQIHSKEPLPGDVLVFLPGQDAIETLERQLNELCSVMDATLPKILVLPLFAALPQTAQQQIFQPAPPRSRKIILSTNIAETSVTVPGIRHVIDCGKAKKKIFHSRLGLEALLPKPISQSEAIQRRGRAGREAPGKCYRLYTEEDYVGLEKNITPEILRCDLSQAILIMKARGVRDVLQFPMLDKPPLPAMAKALELLLQLGALNEDGSINDIGEKMAKLPLTPALGRIIVEASLPERDCLAEIIDILACLSVENVFLNPASEEKREAAEEARRELFRREGDHITMLNTVRAYTAERTDRRDWAQKHFVNHRAMQNVSNVRKQLHAQCKQLGFLDSSAHLATEDFEPVTEEKAQAILRSLLAGFLNNTAVLTPDGSYRTIRGRHVVAIHPSSVLFGRKLEAIVFSEFVFTSKAYARGVSAVQIPWISDLL